MTAVPTVEPRGLGLAQLITSIIFGILTTVVVFLRTFIRVKNRVFGADDMLMVIGYVGFTTRISTVTVQLISSRKILFMILVGVSSQGAYYGAGQRDAVLPEGIYPRGRFYVWLFQIFYCASLVFIKASICDALLRIAVIPWHRVVAWMTLAMAVICAMIVFIGLFVLCKPLSATWNGDGKCSPPSVLAILACFVSASSILTDIICAALPALMLYKAQMKLATKVSISMVLGLGALASVATIIRMPFVLFYFHPNPDYLCGLFLPLKQFNLYVSDKAQDRHCHVALWSTIEAGIGIIADQYETYQEEASQKLIAELERILQDKFNDVVLDLSFYDKEYRDEYKDIVERKQKTVFLDVVTPIETFESPLKKLAPVIFWLSGGGYMTGEKGWFDPAGLIKASYASSSEGLVFVSANYRLGALGWLAGSKLDPETMVANAALYNQRLALEWIQENIHQFGGDPARVTIMGESAGGASIYHHLIAFGGKDRSTLFQRAIPQSTGWVHIANDRLENDVINKFLALANVPDLEAARRLTTGPFVDGLYVPKNPDKLFAEGRRIQNVDLSIGFNEVEGLIFTSPESNDNAGYRKFLELTYSNTSPETLDHIETTLYPPVFDGSYGYTNQTGRASITKAESEFTCKYGFLQAAYGNRAKSYRFNVHPGLHGSEMHYTFYNGPDRNPEVDEGIAVGFQELLTSFAATGNATSLAAPQGGEKKAQDFDLNNEET
ncbi:hypothetical protein FVER53590_12206 [Fusarium verticillioides]|nr:hypothetical protein FVER53590_12206 [Fusarium verticillioides]